jgi:hypothetical protein
MRLRNAQNGWGRGSDSYKARKPFSSRKFKMRTMAQTFDDADGGDQDAIMFFAQHRVQEQQEAAAGGVSR